MEHSRAHGDLASGTMQWKVFYNKFDANESFTVRAINTERRDVHDQPIIFTFLWKDLVHSGKNIMFLTPFNTTHPFDPLFCRKTDQQFTPHVFKNMALEYWGVRMLCTALRSLPEMQVGAAGG